MNRTLNIFNTVRFFLLVFRTTFIIFWILGKDKDIKVTFDDSLEIRLNEENINDLNDYLTLETIQNKSEITEATINELADEIDSAVWETLKSKYIKE
ncbi:hypothetical protein [Crocosphaera chwakensis]|uniref:Uncharacterized protein n=1 Tax=Crocosphaera chwakensis CCY0110 TaxID=391612 RepID=A3ISD6_9CHRO|nr:hypothetical protein [Crocosphaera chwakensis]EAZ90652.1 hypothetical protein CY0110_08256 [Crocosphaera chwakensis CCY0110]